MLNEDEITPEFVAACLDAGEAKSPPQYAREWRLAALQIIGGLADELAAEKEAERTAGEPVQ